MGRESLPREDPDYPAFMVASHVLGGHFYSRLNVALRHEGGETYGAFSTNLCYVFVVPYGFGTFSLTSRSLPLKSKSSS